MRIRWRLLVAVLALSCAAAILAAVALGAPTITITSLQVRAGSTQITSGPMGSGYDIQIQATVTDTQWQSTRWITGGVARCVNHADQSAGTRTVTLPRCGHIAMWEEPEIVAQVILDGAAPASG